MTSLKARKNYGFQNNMASSRFAYVDEDDIVTEKYRLAS